MEENKICKKTPKNKTAIVSVENEIIMESRSHRQDINRPRCRYKHKYTKWNKDRRVVHRGRVAMSDNEWYNEWKRVVQRVTASDSESLRVLAVDYEWQRVLKSNSDSQQVTMNDSEWYNDRKRVVQPVKTNDPCWIKPWDTVYFQKFKILYAKVTG